MKILARIRNRFHADIYALISRISEGILEKMESIGLQMQDHTEKIDAELQSQTEKINAELQSQTEKINVDLQEQAEKLNQQVKAISEMQEQIRQLSIVCQNQAAQLERNGAVTDGINAAVSQMNASVLSILNSAMPYFPLIRSYGEETVANVNAIYSFCLNETIKKQIPIEETEIYQYYKKMHDLTACYKIVDSEAEKCRIGRQHDGGYVMITPFSAQKIAYSIGICDDVSWDKEMAEYGYELYQYDHTITCLPEENEAFHWKKIGLTGLTETEELKRLDTIIRDNGHENCTGMILKMDIEGYEWDLLSTCDQNTLCQFDQIIMEIHWLNDSCVFEKILAGLEKLTLSHAVVHVHGNNYRYAAFCGDMITPDVMEITLIKKDLYHLEAENGVYMGRMDQVNRPNSQDIWIGRW